MSEAIFEMVDIGRLKESALNPRQRYDEKKIEELAESMKNGVGVIEPLVVRRWRPGPSSGLGDNTTLEIIAGSRRLRAALKAELTEIPVMIREIDDGKALEIMVIENNQREDVNALEEAEGYKRLLERKYSLELLAEKIGRSTKYIYDRLKLLQLVPEAKKLLLADKISPGHAILLARLKPAEQKRALDPDNRDVWKYEHLLFAPDDEPEEEPFKIVSVRELEAWIDQHVRFDKKKEEIDPMLFPETAETVRDAKDMKLKVIQISHNYQTHPDAKEGNSERIYHVSSWKRADGSSKEAKTCEKSVTGVIVVGPDRGKAYKVCVHKECPVHWGKEKRERERRAKANGPEGATKRYEADERRRQEEQRRFEETRTAWKKVSPKVLEACAEKLKIAKLGPLSDIIQRTFDKKDLTQALKFLPKPKNAEGLLQILAMAILIDLTDRYSAVTDFPKWVKCIGVDVAAILKAQAAAEPTCAKCGCTESKACQGGCSWLTLDKKTNRGICSNCGPVHTSAKSKLKKTKTKTEARA